MTSAAPTEAPTFPVADLDRRLYAFALDRAVAWSLYAVAGALAWRFLLTADRVGWGIGLIVAVVVVVGALGAVLLGVAGTSPGRAAFGLRVVHHGSGTPIGVGPALVRTLIIGLATLPTFGIGLASLVWTALADPSGQRRGWHDRRSHAVVLDVRPAPADTEEESTSTPHHIVNLTAMRLVPAPAQPPVAAPARRRESPQAMAGAPVAPGAEPPARAADAPSVDPAADRTGGPTVPPAERGRPQMPTPSTGAPVVPPSPMPQAPPPTPGAPWRITFDSGESLVVDGLVLIGRGPQPRPGEPVRHLVPLSSHDMSVSKTHAQVHLARDGALVVMDRGSTNGSVLLRQGVSRDLTAGKPATLLDGDRVRFGDREIVVSRDR